jgi:hypothetical protein
MKEVGYAW